MEEFQGKQKVSYRYNFYQAGTWVQLDPQLKGQRSEVTSGLATGVMQREGETMALWKSREGWGDSVCSPINHYKIFSWSAATILQWDSRTAPSAILSAIEDPELGIRICSFPEK